MKKRWIRKVDLEVSESGFVWVHTHWNGKPDVLSDGTEVRNRHRHTNDPGRRSSFIRRARQMQDALLARAQ